MSATRAEHRTPIGRVAVAGTIGTTLEWFDFFTFSTTATLVFNKLFFPDLPPLLGTVAALGTFAAGFLSRPLGSILFGHFGDKHGRKATLITTMMLMGGSTFVVGLLPTTATIGYAAPMLLIVIRLIQGLGLGGEWGGAVVMCVEHAPKNRRGLYSSYPQLGVPIGAVLSSSVIALITLLPNEQFLSWGWRIPFWASLLLLGVGLFVRFQIFETPAFSELKEVNNIANVPTWEVFRNHKKHALLAIGTRLSESVTSNIYLFFVIVYLNQHLQINRSQAVVAVSIACMVSCVTIPFSGALSDRFGRRPIYFAGALVTIVFAFPAFIMMDTRNIFLVWAAILVGLSVGWALMYGAQAAMYAELFPARVRYSAIGFVYSVGALPAGAIAAAVATSLLSWSDGESWPVSSYLIVMAIISAVSVLAIRETSPGIRKTELAEKCSPTKMSEKGV